MELVQGEAASDTECPESRFTNMTLALPATLPATFPTKRKLCKKRQHHNKHRDRLVLGVRRQGRENDHLPPSSATVTYAWN
jgi:hypothetical protein